MQSLSLIPKPPPLGAPILGTGLQNLDGALRGGYARKGVYVVTSRNHRLIWDFMAHAARCVQTSASLYVALGCETRPELIARMATAESGATPAHPWEDTGYLAAVQRLPIAHLHYDNTPTTVREAWSCARGTAQNVEAEGRRLDLIMVNLMVAPDWSGEQIKQAKAMAQMLDCPVLLSVWVKERIAELSPSYPAIDCILSLQEHQASRPYTPLTIHLDEVRRGHEKHRVSVRYNKCDGALSDA